MSQGLFHSLESCGKSIGLWGGAFQTENFLSPLETKYNLTVKPLTTVANESRFTRLLKDHTSVSFLRLLALVGSLNSFNLVPSFYRWANEGAEREADLTDRGYTAN